MRRLPLRTTIGGCLRRHYDFDKALLRADRKEMVYAAGSVNPQDRETWKRRLSRGVKPGTKVPRSLRGYVGTHGAYSIIAAHTHAMNHRGEILRSVVCGCFHCLRSFSSIQIIEWVDEGETSLCPKCGIDSVLGSESGYPVDKDFLRRMRDHWFAVESRSI